MRTPISDFLKKYALSDISRFHMPGHKGKSFLGIESHDITEVKGADVLDSAEGIIKDSEAIATEIFGSGRTVYSTEGSTLAIRTMLFLATSGGATRPLVLAARNAHKSFVFSAALLDLDVQWIYPEGDYTALASATVTPDDVVRAVRSAPRRPSAVYVTSPDYLGGVTDVRGISEALKEFDVPLLVDNAHGSYLKFLEPSEHPIDLGADMCCDSAHKTLPVLTGGAYLHLSERASQKYGARVKSAMSVFASTSPSYLILESLDLCNLYMTSAVKGKLSHAITMTETVKSHAKACGLTVLESEPLKITVDASAFGYTGEEMAEIFRRAMVEVEYADPDYLVLMTGMENSDRDFDRVKAAISSLFPRSPIQKTDLTPIRQQLTSGLTVREALFGESEIIEVDEFAVGRTVSAPGTSCPPAIPIVSVGEIITEATLPILRKYGISKISVVKETGEA